MQGIITTFVHETDNETPGGENARQPDENEATVEDNEKKEEKREDFTFIEQLIAVC